MVRVALWLLLGIVGSWAEEGTKFIQDGWVTKKEDATAGGAILKKSSIRPMVREENEEKLREIAVHPYQTTESQKVKVGEFFGEEVWFDPRIRPTRCLQSAMDTHNFAKTPEPTSLSLLVLGGTVLTAFRKRPSAPQRL